MRSRSARRGPFFLSWAHKGGWEGGGRRITGKWTCSKTCAHTLSTADLQAMALPVHTGAPAGTYYELLEYAKKLAPGLEDAGDETIASGAWCGPAVPLCHQDVGGCTWHWAPHVWPLRMLRLREAYPNEYACTLVDGGEEDGPTMANRRRWQNCVGGCGSGCS
jgi:hypothetical protein